MVRFNPSGLFVPYVFAQASDRVLVPLIEVGEFMLDRLSDLSLFGLKLHFRLIQEEQAPGSSAPRIIGLSLFKTSSALILDVRGSLEVFFHLFLSQNFPLYVATIL